MLATWTAEIGWTRVHAIIKSTRAFKGRVSETIEGLLGDMWTGLIKDSSDVASSDDNDFLRFKQSGSTVWIAIVIFIEQLASRLIGTVGPSSNGRRKSINLIARRSRSDGHDALDLSLTLAKLPERWILIE